MINRQYLFAGRAVFTVQQPYRHRMMASRYTYLVQSEIIPLELGLLPPDVYTKPPYHMVYRVGTWLQEEYNHLSSVGVPIGMLQPNGDVAFIGKDRTISGQLFQAAIQQILARVDGPLLIHKEGICCICGRSFSLPGDPDFRPCWQKSRWKKRQQGTPDRCQGLCHAHKIRVQPIFTRSENESAIQCCS